MNETIKVPTKTGVKNAEVFWKGNIFCVTALNGEINVTHAKTGLRYPLVRFASFARAQEVAEKMDKQPIYKALNALKFEEYPIATNPYVKPLFGRMQRVARQILNQVMEGH